MTQLTWHRDEELQRFTSEPEGYVIEANRGTKGSAWFYNGYRGEGVGRKHIEGSHWLQIVRDACQRHYDTHFRADFNALKPAQIQREGNT